MRFSSESVALQGFLSHDVPQQHAEHGVRRQAHEHGTHAFIQTQNPLRTGHFHQAVQEPGVEPTLRRSGEQNSVTLNVSAEEKNQLKSDVIYHAPSSVRPQAGCRVLC